jgi:hypothetical protein
MFAIRTTKPSKRGLDVSVVKDLMVHDIYRLLTKVDSPLVKIEAEGRYILNKELDSVYTRLTFENDFVATLTANRASESNIRMHALVGNVSVLSADLLASTLNETSETVDRDFTYPNEDLLMRQAMHFCEMIESNRYEAVTTVNRAAKTLEIAENIERIAKENIYGSLDTER